MNAAQELLFWLLSSLLRGAERFKGADDAEGAATDGGVGLGADRATLGTCRFQETEALEEQAALGDELIDFPL